MFEVQCLSTAVLAAFISMSLLTELISSEDGSYYAHGAPNGAVFPSQHPILQKTAKSLKPPYSASPATFQHGDGMGRQPNGLAQVNCG